MIQKLVTTIIPTYNNPNFLFPCLQSLLSNTMQSALMKIIIVNNGHKDSLSSIQGNKNFEIVQMKENVGWEKALVEGLKYADTPYVLFLNDDTFFTQTNCLWFINLMSLLSDKKIAAIGPTSNVVMGAQNIFCFNHNQYIEVPYLIGFCMMVRKEYLDAVGGIDITLPGGDDIDLSIRFKKAGYKLIVARDSFVFHHGFQTGNRLFSGYWNSNTMTELTNKYLIEKHGILWWWKTLNGQGVKPYPSENGKQEEDIEGIKIRKLIKEGKIVELGCGSNKTVPDAIGVDVVPKGLSLADYQGQGIQISQGDISCDLSKDFPQECKEIDTIIARHILEHLVDDIKALKQWRDALKPDGVLILALPDESRIRSIPVNPEHVHAYNPDSLNNLMELLGMQRTVLYQDYNGISFIAKYEKIKNLQPVS